MAASGTAEPDMEKTLETCRDAVNEMAGRSRGLWLSFIALLAYLFITVGAVTHRDLLLQTPVTLPVLNVGLPLTGFFAIAPLFFLINHFYLLLQLKGLSRRIREFNDTLATADLPHDQVDLERRKLDSFVVVQLLGGTYEETSGRTSLFLKSIALITLVLAPLVLLLMIQLQFLAYQSESITWLHRIAILIDIALLWIFWPAIRTGNWTPVRKPRLMGTAVYGLMFFVCLIATFPGEYADGGPNARDWTKHTDSRGWWIKDKVFGGLYIDKFGYVDYRIGIPSLCRNLYLPDALDLIDLDTLDKALIRHKKNGNNELWQAGYTRSFRNRNLRGAVFDRSDLRHVDFSYARLQGSSLSSARLQGASLHRASLNGGQLVGASLQKTSLHMTDLKGAALGFANLQGASLESAFLQEASLFWANLQGASLEGAFLNGALLDDAHLEGALLKRAQLQGASIAQANLQGASLEKADLQGASLNWANLSGASLKGAKLQAASLQQANLKGASLTEASLQGTSLSFAKFEGTSLDGARLWRTYGNPKLGYKSQIRLNTFDLSKMNETEYSKLLYDALAGIENKELEAKIKNRLYRLKAKEDQFPDPYPNSFEYSFWEEISSNYNEHQYYGTLTEALNVLACKLKTSPYISAGLIRNRRLRDVGPNHLPQLAKYLLDAAEGHRNDCPGVKGLDVASIAKLREWARPAEHSENAQAAKN